MKLQNVNEVLDLDLEQFECVEVKRLEVIPSFWNGKDWSFTYVYIDLKINAIRFDSVYYVFRVNCLIIRKLTKLRISPKNMYVDTYDDLLNGHTDYSFVAII